MEVTIEQIINSKNTENDELWRKLINMFFDEEKDVLDDDYVDEEDFIYAGIWISLNLFALDQELRSNLMERFKDPKQFPAIRILIAIEYLCEDDDRESEVMLLIQLLQYAPNSQKQIEDVLFNPELASNYKYSRMLLVDDYVLDDEDIDLSEEWANTLGGESSTQFGNELSDEDPDIPF